MQIQTLRKTPVGSVVEVKTKPNQAAFRGVLLTPVHTAKANTSVCVYRRGIGHHHARLDQIDRILSTPKGI